MCVIDRTLRVTGSRPTMMTMKMDPTTTTTTMTEMTRAMMTKSSKWSTNTVQRMVGVKKNTTFTMESEKTVTD